MGRTVELEIENLLHELEEAKVAFARAYLMARKGPPLAGRPPTTEDAIQAASLSLSSQGLRDPEIIRLELLGRLGITNAGAK